jgi:hypothetical protein
MADLKSLQDKRDALYVQLAGLTEQINILQKLYQDISECKDELNRLIAVAEQGEKRVEPKTLEVVAAEIAAAKPVVIKEEPLKEVVVTP